METIEFEPDFEVREACIMLDWECSRLWELQQPGPRFYHKDDYPGVSCWVPEIARISCGDDDGYYIAVTPPVLPQPEQ